MSANNKVVQDKPLSDEDRAKAFVKDYEAICETHQMRIVTTPAFKMSQDTGDWRIVLQTSVGRLPKQQ